MLSCGPTNPKLKESSRRMCKVFSLHLYNILLSMFCPEWPSPRHRGPTPGCERREKGRPFSRGSAAFVVKARSQEPLLGPSSVLVPSVPFVANRFHFISLAVEASVLKVERRR